METTMAFDLRIAVKRDPTEASTSAAMDASSVGPSVTCVSLAVNGLLDEAGHTELVRRVKQSFEDGADTVIVDMQKIVLEDVACLERFAASLMAERSAGRQVQIIAREPELHARCASMAGSRDWLIADPEADAATPRRAIHLDSGHGGA